MPRPVIYSEVDIKELITIKETKGIPIKEQCRLKQPKAWPYVSINRAIRRYGLAIPKKYAEIKKAQVTTKETVSA